MPGYSAILTAAGESTRMGQLKPLLPWCGVTLIEYQIANLLHAGLDEVIVVLGHEADAILPRIKMLKATHVVNPDYRRGKATSIKTGLRLVSPDADAILLLAVDQPRSGDLIGLVLHSHVTKNALITSPRYQGHGGHPVVFSSALRREMEEISDETQGLRKVFRTHDGEINAVHIDDPQGRLDLNTYENYERARDIYEC